MFKKFTKSDSQGFTIVEVMFVLAIAAMIMLIVFLAVPALQRNARNTGRKSDAGRLATSITDYISNNNGQLPATANTWNTACNADIIPDAGTFSQYSDLACSSAPAVGSIGFRTGNYNAPSVLPAQTDTAVYVTDAVCKDGVPGVATKTGASSRRSVLLYDLETGSGNWNWTCISVS